MKNKIHKLYGKVGIKSDRTKNITKHILLSALYKGGSILCSFLLVPLTISYLDTENYGIWLTLSSFIAWFSFFDVGLGNGLRNKFAEAKAKGDLTLAQGYVSTAYFTIGLVSVGLIFIFLISNFYIDWTKVFNASEKLQTQLSVLMPIVFAFFCLQLVIKLITTIYAADQHHSMQGQINFFIQAGSLLLIFIMTKSFESSLLIFGVIISVFPVLILIALNFLAFNNRYKAFKPKYALVKKEYLDEIFGLGMKFFVIQIAGIILFSTDNIIITQLFGPEEVVPYNIAFKYFSIVNMALSLVITPYWSSVTEAYAKDDLQWIRKSMNSLVKITFGAIVLVGVLVFVAPIFYNLWIGDKVVIPFNLTIFMALYMALTIFYSPFTFFINGTGKVKLQMYSILITSVINIPLSILLAKNLSFGVVGVILSTIICLVPHIILCPIQYWKIVNNHANGIWNK
ncbi:Membrane protein involved in the export of O-antigen and teichoic acid [Flavobacterium gillisiae]|uniref:Membrane protein involved in the export of O-antigen and teichoic acid n=1 Tax=Flavobacterium gillisiae TaxID=150146 RepID=A0A1H3ZRQ0_9FLAO|nr:oligosaccharide flippase family protein [Flavobacterium gillisiae]SEA26071.1 Membrane protein involved in the export of O-antigen and teichoic acid [Flavobacterium gillisiae]